MKGVWIGTSGWVYKHWGESFYQDVPKKDQFAHYTTQFPTVEINSTFYRLPTKKIVQGWHKKSPPKFLFAAKGSRFITHIKRLQITKASLEKYFKRLAPLKKKLAVVLWQLPPTFKNTPENFARLEKFLKSLPSGCRHAVEFRDPGWIQKAPLALLEKRKAACVWLSSQRMPMDFSITSNFIYLRFHGLKNGASHDYTKAELKPWAEHLARAAREGIPAFVYFNNDLNTGAPLNAQMLMKMVGEETAQPQAPAKKIIPKEKRSKARKPPSNAPRSKRLRS